MDPIAHTLIGATLAETPLQKKTPLARATLMIAANIPDIDATCTALGRDFSLGARRGHTHGILAMIVLPLVLTGLLTWYDRRFRSAKGLDPIRPWSVWQLAMIGTLSHPALDWLNNYGVRLLMPFSGQWFYGDSVFIVDPWIWLLAASSVVLAHSESRSARLRWLFLGSACTAVVLATHRVPWTVKAAFVCGVLAILLLRRASLSSHQIQRFATTITAVLTAYILSMVALTHAAKRAALPWFAEQGLTVEVVAAAPVPGRPLAREIIVREGSRYLFASFEALRPEAFQPSRSPVEINDSAIARRGLAQFPGLETWIRLPAFDVEPKPGGHAVRIRDVRYDNMGAGLGNATAFVPSTQEAPND